MNNNNDNKMGRPMAIVPDRIEQPQSIEDVIKNLYASLGGAPKNTLDDYTFPDVPDDEIRDIGYMPYPDYVCKFVHENYPRIEAAWSNWYTATKLLFMWHHTMYASLSDEMMRCGTKETDPDTFMTGRVIMATDATLAGIVDDSHTIVENWQSHNIKESDLCIADRMERHVDQEHTDDIKLREEGRKSAHRLRIVAPLNHKRRMLNYRLNVLCEKVPQSEIDALEAETQEKMKDV